MALWKCSGCGYIHDDDEAPQECPKCGAPKEAFEKLSDEQESLVTKSQTTNAAWMAMHELLEDAYEIAGTIHEEALDPACVELAERSMQDFEEIIQSIKAEIESHVKKGKWG